MTLRPILNLCPPAPLSMHATPPLAAAGAGGRCRKNVKELFKQADAQIMAVADPASSLSLQGFYYKNSGIVAGGRQPALEEIEKHYAAKTPNFRCASYVDFRVMLE